MKIAVAYDNGSGNVFQHFGKSENFKVYEVEDSKVVNSEVIGTDGLSHCTLASMLAEKSVDVLVCGGIGKGAIDALSEQGLEVVSGAEGNADEAVEKFLKGELESAGMTCSEDHDHSCGGHGCHGGCGGHAQLTGENVGKTCRVHYKGTLNDGTQFDSSYDRDEPLEFICGAGMMIKGFDKAVADMKVGEIKDIHLTPDEAYGYPDPAAIFVVEIAELPGSENLEAGQQVYLTNQMGQPFPVKVVVKDETTITFDANHEMAGKELNFTIELVEVV